VSSFPFLSFRLFSFPLSDSLSLSLSSPPLCRLSLLPHSLSFHLDNKRAKTRSEQKLPDLFSLLSLSTPSKPKNSSLIFRLDYKQKRPFQFLSLSLLFLSLKKKKEQEKEKNRREKSKDKTRQKKKTIYLSK
jgi:hypothetical protein